MNQPTWCCPRDQLQILLSSGDAEGAASVAMTATQRYSQSVTMWSLSLQTLMELGSRDIGRCFQDALKHVNPKVHTHTGPGEPRLLFWNHIMGFSNFLILHYHINTVQHTEWQHRFNCCPWRKETYGFTHTHTHTSHQQCCISGPSPWPN